MARQAEKQRALEAMDEEGAEEMGDAKLGYHAILGNFTETTTAHGVPHVHNAQGTFKIVFWTIISLVASGGLIWNAYYLIYLFASFEVDVMISVESERSLYFPAVTLCNHNAIQKMKLDAVPSLKALTDAYVAGRRRRRDVSHQKESEESRVKRSSGSGETQDARFLLLQQITDTVSDMSTAEKLDLGYEASAMLLNCQFNGYECNITTEFVQFYDATYGNCYTYNWGQIETSLQKSTKPGAAHGLSIVYNVDQLQYMGDLTESAGMRVVVHNQTAMPFPSDEGISVSPGTLTYVGVVRTDMSRMSEPYGTCYTASSTEELYYTNVYSEIAGVGYSSKACFLTCFQRFLMQTCGCGDGQYPMSGTAFGSLNVSTCKSNDATQMACEEEVQTQFNQGTLPCTCVPPCSETLYTTAVSSVIWPSDAHTANIEAQYGSEPSVSHLFVNGSTDYKTNMGKIMIYFQEFNYEVITESADYTMGSLISDLGGILGLYLGFSALTILEFFELLGDLLVWLCISASNKKKSGNTPVTPVKDLQGYSNPTTTDMMGATKA